MLNKISYDSLLTAQLTVQIFIFIFFLSITDHLGPSLSILNSFILLYTRMVHVLIPIWSQLLYIPFDYI